MKRTFAALLLVMCLLASAALAEAPAVQEDYPRTKVRFLYADYSNINTSGEARVIDCMIIPVHFTDGYGYDDDFVQQVDKVMNGKESYSVRQYYLNASYGKIDLQYELLPVHEVGMSSW